MRKKHDENIERVNIKGSRDVEKKEKRDGEVDVGNIKEEERKMRKEMK